MTRETPVRCAHCGQIIVQDVDGVWIHDSSDSRRCHLYAHPRLSDLGFKP